MKAPLVSPFLKVIPLYASYPYSHIFLIFDIICLPNSKGISKHTYNLLTRT
jgi:hypothetical protein